MIRKLFEMNFELYRYCGEINGIGWDEILWDVDLRWYCDINRLCFIVMIEFNSNNLCDMLIFLRQSCITLKIFIVGNCSIISHLHLCCCIWDYCNCMCISFKWYYVMHTAILGRFMIQVLQSEKYRYYC